MRYILDDNGNPVPELEEAKWRAWYATDKQVIARDTVGAATITTVFTSFVADHAEVRPRYWWQTALVGGPEELRFEYCFGLRIEAVEMHAAMVERAKQAEKGILS